MIEGNVPESWKSLQFMVAQILKESGVSCSIEKSINTARGKVAIDVWAHDSSAVPDQTYLIECKLWNKKIPQTVVHSFRTVVGDSGANWGAIISPSNFQKGALEAAKYSNVRLLTWDEFQILFTEKWFSNYFVKTIFEKTDPLMEYTEPINSRIFKKADLLTDKKKKRFKELRNIYLPLGSLCVLFYAETLSNFQMMFGKNHLSTIPKLPLRSAFSSIIEKQPFTLSNDILDAVSLRNLLKCILNESEIAISQFDEVFGERE